ncbi:Plasma membrane fusion protein [Citrus sinensis]|nr:Plasma membrane fusion protein [Citrus sinensis]
MINFLSDIVAGEGIQVDANERFLSRNGLELLRPNTQSELIYMLSQLAEHVRDYTRYLQSHRLDEIVQSVGILEMTAVGQWASGPPCAPILCARTAPPRLSSCAPSTLFTASSNFPPKLPISKQNLLPKHQNNQQSYRIEFEISRRDAFLLSFLTLAPSLALPDPANAFSIGISGPKDWLKEQKKKSSKFLLAPIDASRQILNSAYLLLMDKQSDYTNKDLEEVQKMFRSAARDCVPQERNSFVAFQANTGVEVCTFRLIVKNASSLLDNKDPAKLQAEAILDDLIRSFASLNGLAGDTAIELSSRSWRML